VGVNTWDSEEYRIIAWRTWEYTWNFHLLEIEGCLKNGLSRKKALEALESFAFRSSVLEPVVAIVAPRYLVDCPSGIREPGAFGGDGEQMGHLHSPCTMYA